MSSGGDSGCGLFRRSENTWELVGICQGTQINLPKFLQSFSMYGQVMEWTRVSVFADWIDGQVEE
jgi:hypothetical protein